MGDFGMITANTAQWNYLKSWMQRYVNEGKFPGSSILIHKSEEEVFFHAVGLRDVENQLLFERDTVARIYSMTKPITSVAIMMLVERGLFHLDAPLSDFIAEFARPSCLIDGATRIDQTEPCRCPTIHQLMVHTAGLTYPFNPGVVAQEMEKQRIMFNPAQDSLAEMVQKLAPLPLSFHPGTRWEYSVSIDILGRVIEIVSGQSLDVFFQEHIFEPLGMSETAFQVPYSSRDRFAALYTPLEGDGMALNQAVSGSDSLRLMDSPHKSPFLSATTFSGGGGLVGTIDDYAKFTQMLLRKGKTGAGRILAPSTVNFMMRNHLPGDIASMGPQSFAEQPMDGVGFGLGGAVVLDPARARVPGSEGDFSWGGMASTFFWVDPAQELSAIFFTQLSPSSAYPARAELKALVNSAISN